ncbi:MAG TPA: HNH endonuclease [Edaphobacter sp.]|nr:HNH endonuclease [Edaphobacter sp.]
MQDESTSSRFISLTQGLVAIVDDEEFGALSAHKWCAFKVRRGGVYAVRYVDGGRHRVFMHRVVLNASYGMFVDHINGHGLDNRRENLRLATNAQNQRNRGAQKNNKSGLKGVYWHGGHKRWRATIYVNNIQKPLGSFNSAAEAHAAYCAAAKDLHGEFARTA